jgi:hypothetical protein
MNKERKEHMMKSEKRRTKYNGEKNKWKINDDDDEGKSGNKNRQSQWPLVRERTIPTKRLPLVNEI